MILLVGQRVDPHVQKLQRVLAERQVKSVVFDTVAISSQMAISVVPTSAGFQVDLLAEGKNIRNQEVSAVWWRVKPPLIQPLETVDTMRNSSLRTREWHHALSALESSIPAHRWINLPTSQRSASNKLLQLVEAQRMGFDVPPTIVGTDVEAIHEAVSTWDNQTGAVFKPLTYHYELPDKITFTTQISADVVINKATAVLSAPGIYQQNIPKKYELRVTVVGDSLFPVKILSNHSEGTQQDWRNEVLTVPSEICELDEVLVNKILRMQRQLNLQYAAYDFIVTPDDHVVFLEVNPSGQWLWLEDSLGLNITGTLAALLIRTSQG